MVIQTLTSTLGRGVSAAQEALFEPTIRLGVTGLSRSGKTVFITALVANLLNRGRMPGLAAAARGDIRAAFLQPQPDDTIPRFAYEEHLAKLTAPDPVWPQSTRAISELRLSLRIQPTGLLGSLGGPRIMHLDIVDYPGEWLLDLGLLDMDYATWSARALDKTANRPGGAAFLAQLAQTDPAAPFDELPAQALAKSYASLLQAARRAGFSDCTPGRFLLPGDLDGSPALTFAPLPPSDAPRGSLAREFARRFEAYKAQVVKPFFRDHFARLDRQIVLVDVLGALAQGPRALADLSDTMEDILRAFRPGRTSWLASILGRRIDKILFAATKADHLHHTQHAALTHLTGALLAQAKARAEFSGAQTHAMAIAALRATVEDTRPHHGSYVDVVIGHLANGRQVAFHPGDLPDDPAHLLAPARSGVDWPHDFQAPGFAPPRLTLAPGDGPPHIRLDTALGFLIGDRLT